MSCGDNAERAESIPLTIDRERITGAQAQIDSFGSPSITRCARLGVVQAATGWNRSSTRWKQMASLTRGSTDALNRFCVESSVGPRRSASVAPACGGGPVPSQRFPNTARQRRDWRNGASGSHRLCGEWSVSGRFPDRPFQAKAPAATVWNGRPASLKWTSVYGWVQQSVWRRFA